MKRSRLRAAAIRRSPLMAPVSIAASGNMSCTLNTNGARQRRAASHPATPSVIGGDMASTASGLRRPESAATATSAVKPAKPAARCAMLDFAVGNGWTRVTRVPPRGPSRLISLPCHSGSTRCWRYHGSAVTTVDLIAETLQPLDDGAHDHTGGSGVGLEMRTQHQQPHLDRCSRGVVPGLQQPVGHPVRGEVGGPCQAPLPRRR